MNNDKLIDKLKEEYDISKQDIELIKKGDFKRMNNDLIVGWKSLLIPSIYYDFFVNEVG